jgi:hypothetical protein
MRRLAIGLIFLAGLLALPATQAAATCTIRAAGLSITPVTGSTGTYTPPTAPTAQGVTFTVSGTYRTNNNANLVCTVAIAFNRVSLPSTMARSGGGATMPYTIQSLAGGGNTLIYTGGGTPGAANRLAVSFNAAGTNLNAVPFSVNLTAYFLAQPNSPQQSGSYSDALTLNVYNVTVAGVAALRISRAFTATGTVASACTIGGVYTPASDTATISIDSGGSVSTAPIARSYNSVECNGPADVQLTSQSGAVKTPVAAVPGFENLINYSASATFSSANATVDTATIPTATGAESGTAVSTSGTTPSGTLSVTITPAANSSPLLAGSYADTLRITITPQ